MKPILVLKVSIFTACFLLLQMNLAAQRNTLHDLEGVVRLQYQNPGLQVDLGVGLWPWPLPMDFDQDGDMDLLVSSAGYYPYNGLYFFENASGDTFPVFKKPVRLGDGPKNIQVSYVNNEPRVLGPGIEYTNFRNKMMTDPEGIFPAYEIFSFSGRKRFSQWKYVETNNTGENIIRLNAGTAGGSGRRKICLADWDHDGDMDLLVNSLNVAWYENTGEENGKVKFKNRGDLMNIRLAGHDTPPTVVDWNKDGIPELLVGAEDGHFYYLSRK